MQLFYATTNQAKVHSLQKDFEHYGIQIIQVPIPLPEPRSSDVKAIAREKVLYAFQKLHQPVLALDAGFYIFALNGFPKAYVNFMLETIGIEGILKLVADTDRACEFRECLAYFDGSLAEPQYFVRHFKGAIATQPLGQLQSHLWSPLSLIFIPEESSKTLAQMTYQEYLEWERVARKKASPEELFDEWFLRQHENFNLERSEPCTRFLNGRFT